MVERTEREQLARIAEAQRVVILAVAVSMGAAGWAAIAGIMRLEQTGTVVAGIGWLLGTAMGLYGSITLAYRLSGASVAAIVGLLMFLPFVSLLTLLLLFNRANKRLKDGGAKIGLFGANPAQFGEAKSSAP